MSSTKPTPLRVLVVDDEPDARDLLVNWLAGIEGAVVVGVAGDATEAAKLILAGSPQLILLDIQMPEQDAFELIESIGAESMPEIIFTTAYDEFALKAFEVNAVDYLMKPFSLDRLKLAVARARDRVYTPSANSGRLLAEFLHRFQRVDISPKMDETQSRFLSRIVIKSANPWKSLECDAIFVVRADGAFTRIETERETYTHFKAISDLERSLEPRYFCRVHRNAIVNLNKVSRVITLAYGSRQLVMTNGTRVKVSRSYRDELQARMVLLTAPDS